MGQYQGFFVTAVDTLDQEGVPSAGAWGDRMYWNVYKSYFQGCQPADANLQPCR